MFPILSYPAVVAQPEAKSMSREAAVLIELHKKKIDEGKMDTVCQRKKPVVAKNKNQCGETLKQKKIQSDRQFVYK